MENTTAGHPSDDELSRYALDGEGVEVGEHIRNCPSCARFVKEICLARDAVAAVPEAAVPAELERGILAHRKVKQRLSAAGVRRNEWRRSLFVVGLGVALVAVFLYVFVVFILI